MVEAEVEQEQEQEEEEEEVETEDGKEQDSPEQEAGEGMAGTGTQATAAWSSLMGRGPFHAKAPSRVQKEGVQTPWPGPGWKTTTQHQQPDVGTTCWHTSKKEQVGGWTPQPPGPHPLWWVLALGP